MTDTNDDDTVLLEVSERIATITLNRPDVRNALSSPMLKLLAAKMREADQRDDVDVLILTGTDPAFCAGLDLKELGSSGDNVALLTPEGSGAGTPWTTFSKPLIGAVNGVAVTGGLELALHCDILVASERARFADTHARVGVMPAWGLSVLLPRAVGTRLARQMSLTGDFLTAPEALRAGLVTAVVPHEDLMEHTARVAATIAANDRAGVRTVLSTYRRIEKELNEPGVQAEAEASKAWMAGFNPAAVEERRAAILSRGRDQTS
jgi:enoyl-CoA hydratase